MGKVFDAFARGSVAIAGSRLVMKAISFAAFYLVTTALSLSEYGLVTLALSVSGPVLVLSGLGLDDLVFSRSSRLLGEKKPAEASALLGGFATVKLAVTAVILAALAFVKSALGEPYERLLDQFFLPLLLWIAFTELRTLADLSIMARERFSWYAAANVVETAGKLAAVAALAVAGAITLPAVIWAYAFGKGLALLVELPAFRHFLPRGAGLAAALRAYWAVIAGTGKWDVLRGLFGQLFSSVNNWVVGLLLGLEAVAVFAVAGTLNSLLAQALPFRQVIFPILSRMSADADAGSFVARRMAKYSFWLNVLLVAVTAAAVPPAVAAFYPKYAAAVPIFLFLTASHFLNSLSLSHAPLLQAYGEQKLLLLASVAGTVSSLTVLPALTWLLGLPGAVLEQHLSTAFIIWLRERRLRAAHAMRTFAFRDLVTADAFDRALLGRAWRYVRSLPRRRA